MKKRDRNSSEEEDSYFLIRDPIRARRELD